MREVLKLSSFILIAIGTIALLLNELVFDWGRAAYISISDAYVSFLRVGDYPTNPYRGCFRGYQASFGINASIKVTQMATRYPTL